MSAKQNQSADLENLLKKALADDLPADVEAGMRERIASFRALRTEDEGRAAAWSWLSRRTVWAALSVLMLIAGVLLQGARARNPLADRISSVKSAYANLETTRR